MEKEKTTTPPVYGGLTVEEAAKRQSEIREFLADFSQSVTDANASEKAAEIAPFLLHNLLIGLTLNPLMERLSSGIKNK